MTDPSPKAVIIVPTFDKVNPKSSVKYKDKKGITMVPALLIKVIKDSHHTSFDSPSKVLM